ncbi:MAG: hypothetical protein OEW44_00820 [Gemmatimonadota bacterium]|nr:hypothetical protein [Gemmatimonadota bacterium]
MKRPLVLASLLALGTATLLSAQTGLTIYQDGRVLVRRTLPLQLPQGASSHRLALGPLDPASLFALDPEVTLTGAHYDDAVDEPSTMRRAVGRTLVFDTGAAGQGMPQTVEAEVLGVDPERFRLAGGEITFSRPGRPRYPADLVQLAPTTSALVRTTRARENLALGFFTSGASWQAAYQVVLSSSGARVSGLALIAAATLAADDAEVQLLAGEVGRAKATGARPMLMAAREAADAMPAAPYEEAVGEAHLYSLAGRLTLRPGTSTTTMLFEPAVAPWERSFTVRGQVPWAGPLMQYGEEGEVPVEVGYLLRRPRSGGFGERPLPAGTWRLYQADAAGRLQLIGESSSGHSAPGSDVQLSAGEAFDLKARRIQTDYSTRRDSSRTVASATYRVTVTNARDSAATVDVLEERRGEWSILESSVPAEKLSSTRTRFRLRVPARGEAVLSYRIRVVW